MDVRFVCAAALLWACACGGQARYASKAMSSPSAATPTKLERSVFARDPNGELSEEGLQKILAAPLELELPARVGILPINAAADWHDATPAEMTVPSTIADEHETNPFMRADSVEELGRRRAAKDSF